MSAIHFQNLFEVTPVTKSEVEIQPCRPVRGILNEAQVFKEPVGDHVFFLYEAVDRVALSMESLGHGADQHFGIAFPSVLR